MNLARVVAIALCALSVAVAPLADARGKVRRSARNPNRAAAAKVAGRRANAAQAHSRAARGAATPRLTRPQGTTHWVLGPLPLPLASARSGSSLDRFSDGVLSAPWFRAGSLWKEVDRWGHPVSTQVLEDKPQAGKAGWWSPRRLRRVRGSVGAGVFVGDDRAWSGPGIPWNPGREARWDLPKLGLQPARTTFFLVAEKRRGDTPLGCAVSGGERLIIACYQGEQGWRIDYEEKIDPRLDPSVKRRMGYSVRAILDLDGDGKMEVVAAQGVGQGIVLSYDRKYRVVARSVDDAP